MVGAVEQPKRGRETRSGGLFRQSEGWVCSNRIVCHSLSHSHLHRWWVESSCACERRGMKEGWWVGSSCSGKATGQAEATALSSHCVSHSNLHWQAKRGVGDSRAGEGWRVGSFPLHPPPHAPSAHPRASVTPLIVNMRGLNPCNNSLGTAHLHAHLARQYSNPDRLCLFVAARGVGTQEGVFKYIIRVFFMSTRN